jgi:hypothetical protein
MSKVYCVDGCPFESHANREPIAGPVTGEIHGTDDFTDRVRHFGGRAHDLLTIVGYRRLLTNGSGGVAGVLRVGTESVHDDFLLEETWISVP